MEQSINNNLMDLFTIVQLFQSLWVLYIVVMLFVKFRNGVAAYLAYIFLVPYMKLSIGGFVLQWNLINIIVLIAFFVHQRKQGIPTCQHHDDHSCGSGQGTQ